MGGRWVVGCLLFSAGLAWGEVAGRVVGPDGVPVADAAVLVCQRDGNERALPVIRLTTDAAGLFRAQAEQPSVWAWALKGELSSEPAKLAAGRSVDLVLRPTAPTVGQVYGSDGQPAAGARVGLAGMGVMAWEQAESPVSAETDAWGWFTLRGVPPRQSSHLFAAKAGQQAVLFGDGGACWPVLMLAAPGQWGRIRASGRLKVTVMAGDQPCPDAQVRMRRTTADGDAQWQHGDWLATDSDMRPGDWLVGVEDSGLPDGWLPGADRTVHLGAEGVVEVTLALQRAAQVVGRVTRLDGRPGARVSVIGEVAGRSYWSATDADGAYRLSAPAGELVVICAGERRRAQAVLPPGEPPRVDFRVRLPEPLRIQLVLPDGRPAPGATVYLDEFGERTADAEGRLVFEPGDRRFRPEMTVHWRDDQGQDWGQHQSGLLWDEEDPDPPPLRLVLVRREKGWLRGRVVDHDGRPLDGVLATLHEGLERTRDHYGRQLPPGPTVASDAAGSYAFADVSAADSSWRQFAQRRITLAKPGYRATGEVEVSGRPPARRAADAVMEPLDGRLAGIVVDGQGQPVAAAMLLVAGCPPRPEQRTGADGRFDLAMAPRTGEQTLLALSGNRLVARAQVRAGQTDLRLVVADAAPLTTERRQAAAERAVDRLHELVGGEYEWDAAADTLAVAARVDPRRALAWLDEIDEPRLRRRLLARCLPMLALSDPAAALAPTIEVERVEPWALRAKAIGGLVDNLPNPLDPLAAKALTRTLAGRPSDWGEGDKLAWLELIPAMARVGHDATRHAIGVWSQEAHKEQRALMRRLWRRPDLAAQANTSGSRAAMAGCLARLARRDPAAALRWCQQLKLRFDGDGTAPGDVEELAERLAAVDLDTALDLAADAGPALLPDGGLRGRILLAAADRADATRRLHAALGRVAATGGMAHAAAVLDPPSAGTWLAGRLAGGLRTEDCIDLAETAPDHARLALEWLTARTVSLPRSTEERHDAEYAQPIPIADTIQAALLRAWCALEPERAVALADAPHLPAPERQARLLFTARCLAGLED